MRIEKINENQIRCFLTKEDLEARNLKLSELAYGSDKAKELLETSPDLNVREIADKVGYDDAYHFSKLFKKRFGVSPTTVKKP